MREFTDTAGPSPSPGDPGAGIVAEPDVFAPSREDEAWAAAVLNGGVAARPVNGQPTTLAEFVDDEARAYRAQGTPGAALVAEHLERLAQLIRWTGATTPAEHEDRMEAWDDELRAKWFDRGYAEGIEAARRELAPYRPE
jgi:hypothetical protein